MLAVDASFLTDAFNAAHSMMS